MQFPREVEFPGNEIHHLFQDDKKGEICICDFTDRICDHIPEIIFQIQHLRYVMFLASENRHLRVNSHVRTSKITTSFFLFMEGEKN